MYKFDPVGVDAAIEPKVSGAGNDRRDERGDLGQTGTLLEVEVKKTNKQINEELLNFIGNIWVIDTIDPAYRAEAGRLLMAFGGHSAEELMDILQSYSKKKHESI